MSCGSANTQMPHQIAYQGMLTNPGGTAAAITGALVNSAGNGVTTVDSAGIVGSYISITLGADGLP